MYTSAFTTTEKIIFLIYGNYRIRVSKVSLFACRVHCGTSNSNQCACIMEWPLIIFPNESFRDMYFNCCFCDNLLHDISGNIYRNHNKRMMEEHESVQCGQPTHLIAKRKQITQFIEYYWLLLMISYGHFTSIH